MKIWIDGSGALLRGQKARTCVMFDREKPVIDEFRRGTVNEMEYLALSKALGDPRSENSVIYSDSQLVVNQLTKGWKVDAENLRPLHEECKGLLKSRKATIVWIRREDNEAGKVLDKGT